MVSVTFDKVADLAAKLPVDDQRRLVEQISSRLSGSPERGSPAAVLAALRDGAPSSREDVAEMERMIEEGKIPVSYRGPFDEKK